MTSRKTSPASATRKTAAKKTPAGKSAARKSPASNLPIEIDARGKLPLGMSPAEFMRDYWHKRPLLIRNAFPGFVSPIEPEDLAGLACEEGALSRIVERDREKDMWTLRSGPFAEEVFLAMPDHDWTVLVQDVDKWDPDVRALLSHFEFLPRWRVDDIMISFAATGGSVGAHVDHYDVFLLQAKGQRRWLIDANQALTGVMPPQDFRGDVELKLLKEFNPTHDWVLNPGDMLYMPPKVPHHGIGVNECLTISFGMRAPSSAELISDYLDTLVTDADEAIRYHDEDLKPVSDPYEIDADAMGRVVEALNALRMNDPDRLGDWFGRFITTYRASGDIVPSPDTRSRIEVEWDLQQGATLYRHPFSRFAWRRAKKGATLFCSGIDHAMPVEDARLLAAVEAIDGRIYATLSEPARDAVFGLMAQGHYVLGMDDDDDGDSEE